MKNRISKNHEFLALTTEEELYTPIKALLYRMAFNGAIDKNGNGYVPYWRDDVYTVTASGKTIGTQNYEDYVNACFCEVFAICKEEPNGDFASALYKGVCKGITSQSKGVYHGRKHEKNESDTITTASGEEFSIADMLESVSHDTERDAINRALISAISASIKSEYVDMFKMLASGYTMEEVASRKGKKLNTVKSDIHRARLEVKALRY